MTDQQKLAARLDAARFWLEHLNCPSYLDERASLVAEWLACDDAGDVSVSGKLVPGGMHWRAEPVDPPRMTTDILGSGVDVRYPIDRWIKELACAYPELRWPGLELLGGPVGP